MKTLKLVAIGAFFSLCCFRSAAQEKIPLNNPNYNKPKIFDDQPQKVNLKVADLESLFDLSVGSAVTAKFSKNFFLHGTVMSKSDDADVTVKSVIIKATNRKGAVFTFTRITGKDGSFTYRGRLLSRDSGDAFELVKENGEYFLEKKDYHEIIAE